MIEPDNPDLSIGKQCKMLSIPRSSFYYRPKGEAALNLALMRQMTRHLPNEGHLVNEKRIRRLVRLARPPVLPEVIQAVACTFGEPGSD